MNNISSSKVNSNLIIVKTVSESQFPLKALIDSAAQTEVICQDTVERLGLQVTPSGAKLRSAQGNDLTVLGECNFNLYFGENLYNVTAVVRSFTYCRV